MKNRSFNCDSCQRRVYDKGIDWDWNEWRKQYPKNISILDIDLNDVKRLCMKCLNECE
tara:strand:- start:332 stop:505 length:174 start_codon:yes stop_codon:yes gene_type:complete